MFVLLFVYCNLLALRSAQVFLSFALMISLVDLQSQSREYALLS